MRRNGEQLDVLFFHTEVKWLSRSKILNILFGFKSEVLLFLIEKDNDIKKLFTNDEWLSRIAYMTDIFDKAQI